LAEARKLLESVRTQAASRKEFADLEGDLSKAESVEAGKVTARELLIQSRKTSDHKQAIQELERALALDGGSDEIRQELAMRRAQANAAPPGPGPGNEAAEKKTIGAVLQQFESRFEARSLQHVQLIYKDMKANDLTLFRSLEWTGKGEPRIEVISPNQATATWPATIRLDNVRGKPQDDTATWTFTLRKGPAGWAIESVKR
jgi:hypothetical protein